MKKQRGPLGRRVIVLYLAQTPPKRIAHIVERSLTTVHWYIDRWRRENPDKLPDREPITRRRKRA